MFLNKKSLYIGLGAFLGSTASVFAEDAVSAKAYHLFEIPGLGLPITNSMVTSWVVSLLLILVIRYAIGRKPALVPSKGQAVVESMVQAIHSTIEPIVGKKMVGPTFPLLIGFFTFILIQNWSGLIPGVGTFGHYDESGHFLYYFRPGNADLNMTLALAIVSFTAWIYYIFRYAGIKVIVYDLFGNKADKNDVPGTVYYFLFLIFFGVGLIEIISILLRLISLSFRLFGNVFGGENLLVSVQGMFSYLLPVPFYFLEVLIGLIQAFVFTLLTAIYIGLICNHGDGEEAHGH
jgi:F-type H+-transporting ATPase subunit a